LPVLLPACGAGEEREGRLMRRLLRVLLALPLLLAGIGAVSTAVHIGPAAPLCAKAASSHRVGLLVEHGDGRAVRRCVGFDTPTATALDVLQASGLEVGISSYGGGLGAAVCQIDNEPATYPPGCFTSTGLYWVLFVSHAGGAWANSNLGASNLTITNGDDIGFRYDSQTGADPPPPSPAGTCPVVTPPPAPTRTPAPTVRSTATQPTPHLSAGALTTPHATTPTPSTTPAAGILGVVTPGATAAPLASVRSPVDQPGINVGILLAAIGAGALIGLLGASVLRRRRE
jgi:hypothetical protein